MGRLTQEPLFIVYINDDNILLNYSVAPLNDLPLASCVYCTDRHLLSPYRDF